jgi:Peroxidase, family 2
LPAILRPQSLQLHDLARQGVIVHNASLTRPDMGAGYSPAVVPAMVEALLADSPNDWIYPRTVLASRERRERESKHARGDRSVGTTGLSPQAQALAYGEAGLLLLALNGTGRDYPKNDPNMRQWPVVPKKAVRTWLLEERLPDGFVAAPVLVTEEISGMLSKLITLWREADLEKEAKTAAPRFNANARGS